MRIFAAGLGTETNSFSPLPTGMRGFEDYLRLPAGQRLEAPQEASAVPWAAQEYAARNIATAIIGPTSFAMPAGPTLRHVYESLRDELLAALKAALPVDVVAYSLHGAMIAEGYDDCEGDLLARTRALVGPEVALGCLLDLHCHVSPQMVESADVIVLFKEYPHIDFAERAEELLDLLARTARREIRPHIAVHDCRMIDLFHTTMEPMRSFVADMQSREGLDGVLSLSAAHGFPWGDTADSGTKMLVVTDGKPALGTRIAAEFGERLFAMRGKGQKQPVSIAAALQQAAEANATPIVIADTADNAGGGAPSDSTFLLQAVIERGLRDVAFGPLWDPIAAGIAIEAGTGAKLDLRIGGKMGPTSGQPLDLDVTVGGICRNAMQSYGASREPLGDCVALSTAGVDIVLNTLRTQAFGPELFTNVGIDPTQKRIVIVKSTHHFHAGFAPFAADVIYVGGPGTLERDLKRLPFRKIARPKWPFDT
ncbi:MAG TPA: M81 family metallopeptidase [Methylomirabilota bacterium]|nr:M81 family metallopeptidase [Methylomirabilota bacterium]